MKAQNHSANSADTEKGIWKNSSCFHDKNSH